MVEKPIGKIHMFPQKDYAIQFRIDQNNKIRLSYC